MGRHVIYVPGLGDDHARLQMYAIQWWRLSGVVPHYLPVGWNRNQGYAVKQQPVVDLVDKLHAQGRQVSLVGVSAGASICLNVFATSSKVSKLIVISGKFSGSGGQGSSDFAQSLQRSTAALRNFDAAERRRILSIHPQADNVVPVADMIIAGATTKAVPGNNHPVGIFFGLVLGARAIGRFTKT